MNAGFKVGDICIGQLHVVDLHLNGMECRITSPLQMHRWFEPISGQLVDGYLYEVEWQNGQLETAFPRSLRKKQPPRSYKSKYRQAMLDCIIKAKEPVRETA
jgi:hypothetical protein